MTELIVGSVSSLTRHNANNDQNLARGVVICNRQYEFTKLIIPPESVANETSQRRVQENPRENYEKNPQN